MGDSKEISRSLVEEGDIYQKVDLAFKVRISRNTLYTSHLPVWDILFISSLSLSPRGNLFSSCTEESGERIVIREICLANKQIFCPPLTERGPTLCSGEEIIES